MKLSKKAMTVLSFTLGTSIFVSTAFADALIGSGYDQLKDSAKYTAAQMEKGLNNFTIEMLYSVKDNGQTLVQGSNKTKVNSVEQANEDNSTTQYPSGKSTSTYSYSDKNRSVWKNSVEDQYYVTEFPEGLDRNNQFKSPFNEQGAPEVEKIFDALVGNLKDYVQVEESSEGGKVFSGSLSEAQVPAIVNAVSSFGMKQILVNEGPYQGEASVPHIESDIYIKKVTGTAVVNKEGLLESVTGDVVLSGKDKNGVQHDLSMNAVFKLSDVGTTKITLPDLTGAKVEKVNRGDYGFTGKYVGTYKSEIVIEKNGQFVKVGERILEITSVDQGKVTGQYSETVKPGFEADYTVMNGFTFEFDPSAADHSNSFTFTNSKGESENGNLHPGSPGKVYLNLSHPQPYYDGQFNRVFAE